MSTPYRIPAHQTTIETEVSRSRFVSTIYPVDSVALVKSILAQRRKELPDASHHVYAYKIGFGNSVIEGLSDDGEPTGTSGPPILSCIRGSDIGDVLIIVTRFFGGTLLGTGGLVRAYTEAAALVIKACPTTLKIAYTKLLVMVDYTAVTRLKRLIAECEAEIIAEQFTESVEIEVRIPTLHLDPFSKAVNDLTSGNTYITELS